MENLVLWIGYIVIGLICFILIWAFYQWALSKETASDTVKQFIEETKDV